jgi:tetratricopeptide (TPR) repeat protein
MRIFGLILLIFVFSSGGCGAKIINHQDAGVQLSMEGRWEEAISEFDEAIKVNPKDSLAYYNRANAYRNLGEYRLAIQDYDEVLGINPRDALAYDNRGDAYLYLNEYDMAIQDYDEALAIFPEFGDAYAGRARSFQSLGKDLQAMRDVDRAVEFGYDRVLLETDLDDLKSQRK